MYKIDLRSGLISESLSNLKDLDISRIEKLKYDFKVKLLKQERKAVDRITLHPVGYNCYGDCSYCLNNCSHVNLDQAMTVERVQEEIDFLKNNDLLKNKEMTILLLGGDPILHPNLESLINVFIDNLPDKIFSVILYTSFFDKDVDSKVNRFIENINKQPQIKQCLISITVDYGSNTRSALTQNISSLDVINYSDKLVDRLGESEKFIMELVTNINKDTDANLLKEELLKRKDKNNLLFLRPIKDLKYGMSLKKSKELIEMLKDNFTLETIASKALMRVGIKNKYLGKIRNRLKLFELNVIRIKKDPDVFLVHPYRQYCIGWLNEYGFSQNKYFGCEYGFGEKDKREDIFKLTDKEINLWSYDNLSSKCKKCDSLASCDFCYYVKDKCTPAVKYFNNFILKTAVANKNFRVLNKL